MRGVMVKQLSAPGFPGLVIVRAASLSNSCAAVPSRFRFPAIQKPPFVRRRLRFVTYKTSWAPCLSFQNQLFAFERLLSEVVWRRYFVFRFP